MSIVMSNNFRGAEGYRFEGDDVYSVVAGNPVFVASNYGLALRFPAERQTIIQQSFTPTLGRVFSRIYRIVGTPTTTADVFGMRSAANGPMYTGQINTARRLVLFRSGVSATSVNQLPVNVEFRVVFIVNPTGTQLTATIFPNIASVVPTETVAITLSTPATIGYTREGIFSAGGLGPGVTIDLAWPQDDTAADPGLRRYVYATVDKTSFIVPETVNVTVGEENLPPGTKTYTVNFGDGTTVGPQPTPEFTHTYSVAGEYDIVPTVDIS